MKTLNIPFDDKEIKMMEELKRNLSWKEFIILMTIHCKEAEKRGDFEVYALESKRDDDRDLSGGANSFFPSISRPQKLKQKGGRK